MNILGFDSGRQRIGVALGQLLTNTARPLGVVPACNGLPEAKQLDTLLKHWQPQRLVLGLPLHADGRASHSSAQALRLAEWLDQHTGLPIELHDERLSSHEAAELSRELGRRRGAPIDDLAAMLILQGWLHARVQPPVLPVGDQSVLCLLDDSRLDALQALLRDREARARLALVVLEARQGSWPFRPCPSRILLPSLPAGVIAAIPLLEDCGIASRIVADAPGCHDGSLESLLSDWWAQQDPPMQCIVAGSWQLARRAEALCAQP